MNKPLISGDWYDMRNEKEKVGHWPFSDFVVSTSCQVKIARFEHLVKIRVNPWFVDVVKWATQTNHTGFGDIASNHMLEQVAVSR